MSDNTTTFVDNMKLPVHRWFRYSAGFSAKWVESVIRSSRSEGSVRVLDPFAGSGTTLIAAENTGVPSFGVESHPFIARIARAKLARRTDPIAYRNLSRAVADDARRRSSSVNEYPPLIRKCFTDETLADLDRLRQAYEACADGSPTSELVWLTLVGILRSCSHVGTAQWQYVLPRKSKKNPLDPFSAFAQMAGMIQKDMPVAAAVRGPAARLFPGDARTCAGVEDASVNLVITSPPYPNNYDYADATRLEMCFLREINGWGDLQHSVRQHLVRSCSQHVPEKSVDLDEVLSATELSPIACELESVCQELAKVRLTKGGKKTYHLMVACYFLDMARVWHALRRVCGSPSRICFVIGDSAPYAVYVPVIDWMGSLAQAAGFSEFTFTKLRDRNTKWKNRKHRVPLCEGELWVIG